MNPDGSNSVTGSTAPRSFSGAKILTFAVLALVIVVIVGGVVLFNAATDSGFRTSR